MNSSELTVLYFGNQLQKHGFTPTGVDYLGDALAQDFNVLRFSEKKAFAPRMLDMVRGLYKNRKAANIVFIDLYSTKAFWFAFVISAVSIALKLPYVLVCRGGDLPKRFQTSKRSMQFIWKNAAARVAPSAYLHERLKMFGAQVDLIENHIKIDDYTFMSRKEIAPNLLYARAIHKKYNPELLVRVLKILQDEGIAAKVSFVGNIKDDSVARCTLLAKELGVAKAIKFEGKMSKSEWHSHSRNFHIFVNPTNVDNTPISVIEALALGLPVISTNVGGVPFLVKNEQTALLVPAKNEVAFANAVIKLMTNEKLAQELALNGRKLAESFDWKEIQPKWKKLIANYAL